MAPKLRSRQPADLITAWGGVRCRHFAQSAQPSYISFNELGEKRSMEDAQNVAEHYAHGSLEEAIFDALSVAGKDPSRLALTDLAQVDEFHIGGREATVDLAQQLPFGPGFHLLDVGCGLGGGSRYFAQERGCKVTGIDLTEDYVRVAGVLAARVGLGDRVSYRRASALALPFARESFDGAYLLHVGMNIRDKAALFAEVRRVLKPGGVFAIYDVMREKEGGELTFPLPWASRPDISFVDSAGTYRSLLEQAGFVVQVERSRRELRHRFFPPDAGSCGGNRRAASTGAAHSDGRLYAAEGDKYPQQPRSGAYCADRDDQPSGLAVTSDRRWSGLTPPHAASAAFSIALNRRESRVHRMSAPSCSPAASRQTWALLES
jgi:ubiquinone/menaquinone biosynthesis C-methylase UbiE